MTPKQAIQSIFDAFQRGDIPTILNLVAADAVWIQSTQLPWGGTYSGPEGAAQFFTKLDQHMATEGFEAREIVESGDDVFSFGEYRGKSRKTGRTGAAAWMFRWKVQAGKVTRFESYIDTAALNAAMQ